MVDANRRVAWLFRRLMLPQRPPLKRWVSVSLQRGAPQYINAVRQVTLSSVMQTSWGVILSGRNMPAS